ncbi:MAG: hypothetical protein ACOX7F_02635 [Eubacteriales bacterium]|jgi:hypothetical protein
MKRYKPFFIVGLLILAVVGGVWLTLRATAHYPTPGEPVSYPVNQAEGFVLSVEEPTWSPFRGYTLRYAIAIDSPEVYSLVDDAPQTFEHLEWFHQGQWVRLVRQTESGAYVTFDIGGSENTGFQGSLVQKYEGYGTRLEPGTYRLTLEMTDSQNEPHYLAAEFEIE